MAALATTPDAPVDPDVLRDVAHSLDQRFWMSREVQESPVSWRKQRAPPWPAWRPPAR